MRHQACCCKPFQKLSLMRELKVKGIENHGLILTSTRPISLLGGVSVLCQYEINAIQFKLGFRVAMDGASYLER